LTAAFETCLQKRVCLLAVLGGWRLSRTQLVITNDHRFSESSQRANKGDYTLSMWHVIYTRTYVCVCVYICMYTYMYTHVYIHMYICISIHVILQLGGRTKAPAYFMSSICVYMFTCMHACMYMHAYIHMCVYIYIHIYRSKTLLTCSVPVSV